MNLYAPFIAKTPRTRAVPTHFFQVLTLPPGLVVASWGPFKVEGGMYVDFFVQDLPVSTIHSMMIHVLMPFRSGLLPVEEHTAAACAGMQTKGPPGHGCISCRCPNYLVACKWVVTLWNQQNFIWSSSKQPAVISHAPALCFIEGLHQIHKRP